MTINTSRDVYETIWFDSDYLGDDHTAIRFLVARGYRLTRKWQWKRPKDASGKPIEPTDIEHRAIRYLFEEWDFDGLAD